jgi:hypothetical protein
MKVATNPLRHLRRNQCFDFFFFMFNQSETYGRPLTHLLVHHEWGFWTSEPERGHGYERLLCEVPHEYQIFFVKYQKATTEVPYTIEPYFSW